METLVSEARKPFMVALEHWTEVLRCPNCGLAGVTNLSQPKQVAAAIVIDNMPEGFRAVSSQYGDTFFCAAATDQQQKLHVAGKSKSYCDVISRVAALHAKALVSVWVLRLCESIVGKSLPKWESSVMSGLPRLATPCLGTRTGLTLVGAYAEAAAPSGLVHRTSCAVVRF